MTFEKYKDFAIAGDVGGTKTNLGLFTADEAGIHVLELESYPSRKASSLEELVERFLSGHRERISRACFGVAGPVINAESKATNLPWVLSERAIQDRFKWNHVRLINDLAATAIALPVLAESDFRCLNTGKTGREGTIGIVAPGTGLGIGLAIAKQGKIQPLASEGGHVDFAPHDEREIDLLRHLLGSMPHVSVERLVSGPGLFTIYSWLKQYRGHLEPVWLTERIKAADPPSVISQAALAEEEPLCVEALDLFVSIMGAVAGNLALTAMTTAGIYLAGGIPPKILPKLEYGPFMKSFVAKGRFESLLHDIPVRVILNDKTALIGAACCAFQDAD